MNFQQYSDLQGVNWSTLKEMGRSPAHYQHRLTVPRMDSPAMRLGRANLRIMKTSQSAQGVDHILAPGQPRPARIGSELALS